MVQGPGRPTAMPGSVVLPGNSIEEFAVKAGFSAADAKIATQIALAESSGNRLATNHNSNGSTDYGLWQINSVHKDALALGDWKDPATNARMAYLVYKQAGNKFTPWVTYNNGAYTKKTFFDTANPAGIGDVLPNPLNAVGGAIVKLGADLATVIVFVALLVIGVVFLLRKPIIGVAGATPIGQVTKTTTKILTNSQRATK